MLSEGLWGLLSSTDSITALIGTPDTRSDHTSGIFPVLMPNATPMPALVISQIAGGGDNTMDGASGLRTARIQFTAHGSNYLQSKTLAKAVRDLLDGIKTTCSDDDRTEIDLGEVVVELDAFQVAPFEYQTPLDIQFWFREALTFNP
jgi:hypothetical protein